MPYISAEQVRDKRNQLKKAFPKYKLSVTTRHNSTICVSVMSGPVDLLPTKSEKYEQVNEFYINENYKDNKSALKLLSGIHKIINSSNYTVVEDGDYGSIPKFYVDITIGKWNKPYEIKK